MADKENPYGKAKKGETASEKKSRQIKYYRQQRVNAEETGDQKTVDKIYSKVGKKSHSVDADAVNKGILTTVATGSLGKLGGLARLGRGAKAASAASKGGKALGAGVQDLGKARPVRAALNAKGRAYKPSLTSGTKAIGKSSQKSLNAGTAKTPKGSWQKALGSGKSGMPAKQTGGRGLAREAEAAPTKMKNVTPKAKTPKAIPAPPIRNKDKAKDAPKKKAA
jgi:hypothetical protein